MMPMRSAICCTSERMWLETRTVMPSAANARIRSRSSSMPMGSSPLVGSSSTSRRGYASNASAIPSRCFMPMEKRPARFLPASESPTVSRTSPMRSSGRPSIVVRTRRFSRAVRLGYSGASSMSDPIR